ncbi:hypothetical protein BDV96DRAFT_643237 [Lophiotrema nucula]|uniref:Uncharacterized protein n=1 Tax=Lophiotrema nucula TaxID=690887 RepID=A0A6A5ZJ68_9PLEO|nr:hypothetical protein BDV96DRAFT_643237 [Lophiotrema nucula]
MTSPSVNVPTPVPFQYPDAQQPTSPSANSPTTPTRRSRTSTNASTASNASRRLRSASIKMMEARPPPGMWAATGTVAATAPTPLDIRKGSFSASGWNEESQRYRAERRSSQSEEGARPLWRTSSGQSVPESPVRPSRGRNASAGDKSGAEPFPTVDEEDMSTTPPRQGAPVERAVHMSNFVGEETSAGQDTKDSSEALEKLEEPKEGRHLFKHRTRPDPERQYSNGYVPPPKVPWKTSTAIGLKAFWKWFLTPTGFLITVYGLNVVAWGGMLFLLLCNAAPAMCNPTCNDIQSPRRIWIEIDSQILNALFCVTGFGLFPWRARDVYWWAFWRLGGSQRKATGIRRLAGIHRGWFRLPGSDALPTDASAANTSADNPAVPIPLRFIPDPPPTGIHGPPSKGWKMDFVVWMNMFNTFFQIVLCFYMWHYNRYERPSWATGFFVAMGCIVAGLGGIMMFHEGKYLKKVEGVPLPKDYQSQPTDVEAQSDPVEAIPAQAAKS